MYGMKMFISVDIGDHAVMFTQAVIIPSSSFQYHYHRHHQYHNHNHNITVLGIICIINKTTFFVIITTTNIITGIIFLLFKTEQTEIGSRLNQISTENTDRAFNVLGDVDNDDCDVLLIVIIMQSHL